MYIWYIRTNEAIDVIVCEHIQNVIESIKKEKCNAKPKYTKRYTQTQPFNMQNRANHEKKWHRADCGVRKRIQQTQTHTHLNNKQREKRRDSTCQNHMPTNTDRPTVWSFCCVDVRPSAILLFVSMCTSLLRIESFTHRVLLVAAFQLLYNLILRVCERRETDMFLIIVIIIESFWNQFVDQYTRVTVKRLKEYIHSMEYTVFPLWRKRNSINYSNFKKKNKISVQLTFNVVIFFRRILCVRLYDQF